MKEIALYKKVCSEIINVLAKNKCSSILDIKIIYNLLLGLPFILQHGALYQGEYYEKLSDIPEEAKNQFYQRYNNGVCAVDPYIVEKKFKEEVSDH